MLAYSDAPAFLFGFCSYFFVCFYRSQKSREWSKLQSFLWSSSCSSSWLLIRLLTLRCLHYRIHTEKLVQFLISKFLQLHSRQQHPHKEQQERMRVTISHPLCLCATHTHTHNTYIGEDMRAFSSSARRVIREEHELRRHRSARTPCEQLERSVIAAIDHVGLLLLLCDRANQKRTGHY